MPKFEKFNFRRETYVDKLVEIIEYRISSGQLNSGEKISEIALAKEFNISRSPAREALFRLEEMGLVIKKHSGREVKRFTIDEFRENYELRIIVEGFCCAQGALNATKQQISRIKDVLGRIKSLLDTDKEKERLILNSKFHEALVLCSQNNLLVEIYQRQVKQFGWLKYFPSLSDPRTGPGYFEHIDIFDAFVKKDSEKVRSLTEKHRRTVMEIMLENIRKRAEKGMKYEG